MYYILLLLLIACALPALSEDLVKNHLKKRNELLRLETEMMLGSDTTLTDKEEKVNKKIMELKHKIIDEGFANPEYFNFSKHFFTYKDEVKQTRLYKILHQMPKGGLLHGHDTGLINADYIMNITYWDNLYVCFVDDSVDFIFSAKPPTTACRTEWQLMADARRSAHDIKEFDAELRKHFTIIVDNPNEIFTDINAVWSRFQGFFIVTTPLLSYKPAWKYYFYKTMEEFRKDNVMYIELRSVLPELYDLEGNVYGAVATAKTYKEVVDKFVRDYPDFVGVKLIYAPMRLVDEETIEQYIDIAKEIKEELPGFLAGFDVVGQEDLGRPIKDFLPQLTEIASEFDFYFHAGETNWYGTSTDENLVDAIVLGTRRLGHAYALSKYPVLMDEVKKREIGVEVNVLSNVVLALVSDVRNHPAATYIARGLPVVIASDNPGAWGADPMTHDYLVTFVGVASRHADLRLLKRLALNSIVYSAISNKNEVLREFELRWDKFVDDTLRDFD